MCYVWIPVYIYFENRLLIVLICTVSLADEVKNNLVHINRGLYSDILCCIQ